MLSENGVVTLSFEENSYAPVGADEVVVRVEATPLNPSDLRLLFGPANIAELQVAGSGPDRVVSAPVSPQAVKRSAARLGRSMQAGNEGAGTVVAAGSSAEAQALLGRSVSMIGGAMYAQYRVLDRRNCHALPDGLDPAHGASWFINPMTALAFLETMHEGGHRALVHTAAASNLGQMLNRLCIEEGIDIVNVVRNESQRAILSAIGARYVVDSSAETFRADLTDAIASTGATVAFDATGGGTMAGTILSCMESALTAGETEYNLYGSYHPKQVYTYGSLDTSPTQIIRDFGFAWSLSGWLLWPTLVRLGAVKEQELRERVVRSLTTTFASSYTNEISLIDVLDPTYIREYAAVKTGEKYLVRPQA
ncbi:MDR/zinc-dependent alcohol dehydrogenase-like family protein [Saccharopolyspora pogona]|uniref:hypothetical protein n=1 Tax=Saccharopolyspora pogona TaxID=333966 RepID=UPI001CC242E6|nr:hypothetical protein [Saccharopolyspora pogona]